MSPLSWVGFVLMSVREIVDFIRWLDGDDVATPPILSRVPVTTKSAAVRIRMRALAALEFSKKPPPT